MCPHITPGIEPNGTNSEQIRDAAASLEKRPGACFWLVAPGDDDEGRDAVCGIGAGGGEAGAAAAAAGMVMFF
jgi:hypothetical protein